MAVRGPSGANRLEPTADASAIRNALLRRIVEDSETKGIGTLQHYQSLFPGYEATVAEVLTSLSSDDPGLGEPPLS